MRVAVVGATGAVGRRMVSILEERSFPVDELVLLASERSVGTRVSFRGEEHALRLLSLEALEGVDLALSSCGGSVARTWIPQAAEAGTFCVDNSSAFRMEPYAALTIPEVNPESLAGKPRIACVPNCTIITALLAAAPLHRAAGLRSLFISSYQSVAGAGQRGIRELVAQIGELHGREEELERPDLSSLPVGEVIGKTIAYNVVAKIDLFDEESGYTFEELKMQQEARKILSLPDLEIATTAVRVPVIVGHAVSIHATFSRPISVGEAREVLAAAPSVELRDDPSNGIYPSPLEAAGLDIALVGRIRQVPDRDDALLLFSCADNLRKGAALNAVQIAEHLFA
ncbi:MAG: aspartate-semialdehyde dehydrogenase [Actinomycetota bacterium]